MKELIVNLIKTILSFGYFLFRKKSHDFVKDDRYSDVFFGYYDISSFNSVESTVLAHGLKEKGRAEVDILMIDAKTKEVTKVGNTKAWNFQQGSRLQWVDDSKIIYNKYDDKEEKYVSVLYDVNSGKSSNYNFPIQVMHNGEYFLSINYYHLKLMGTEYGYDLPDTRNLQELLLVNMNNSTSKVLFEIEDCIKKLKHEYANAINHHINHFLIKPDGKGFIFMLRFEKESRRFDNLFYYSIEDKEINLLIENELLSHCSWRDDDSFIFWGKMKGVAGYYLYSISNMSCSIALTTENDGHPSFIDRNRIITDTYPDRFLREKLYTIDLTDSSNELILEVSHPAFYTKKTRCDLHPSISKSGKYYQIDVMMNGGRKMIIDKL